MLQALWEKQQEDDVISIESLRRLPPPLPNDPEGIKGLVAMLVARRVKQQEEQTKG